MTKSKFYWTFELCYKEAKKYSTKAEFQKKSNGCYKAAWRNKWLSKICDHMIKPIPVNKKWDFETCKVEAKKYKFKKDFHLHSNVAFQIASKNKWLEDICQHMIEIKKPHKYWTKEKCKLEAKKFNHRIDFSNYSNGAYSAAQKNNWLEDICDHMEYLGNELLRFVYSFSFSDGSVYFGLTNNWKRRIVDHKSDTSSKVFKQIKLLNEEPTFTLITPKLISSKLAQKLEKQLIKDHLEKGFNVLNVDKGGGIGGSKLIWTKDKCKHEALKYKTRGEFQLMSKSVYSIAHKRGWLNDICKHMMSKKKPHYYWSKEKCKKEAAKFKNKSEFRIKSSSAYNKAYKSGWLEEICSHMLPLKKENRYWNFKRCLLEARKYSVYIEFQKKSSSAYNAALKNNWLEEIKKNFKNIKKPNGYWSFDNSRIEALKYKNKRQFSLGSVSAYDASRKNNWLNIFFKK